MLLGPQSCLSLLEREISTLSQKEREHERAGLPPLPSGQQPHLQVQHLLIKARRTKKWMFVSHCAGVKATLKQIGKTVDLAALRHVSSLPESDRNRAAALTLWVGHTLVRCHTLFHRIHITHIRLLCEACILWGLQSYVSCCFNVF